MLRTPRLLLSLPLALMSLGSSASADDVLEAIDAGRQPQVAAVDDQLRSMEAGEVSAWVKSIHDRRSVESAAVKRSARFVSDTLRSFPQRELARVERHSEGAQPEIKEAAERFLEVVRCAGEGAQLMPLASWSALMSERGLVGDYRADIASAALEVLERDPDARGAFVRAYEFIPDELVRGWIDVLRRRAHPLDLHTASLLLGRRPGYDAIILNRMQVLTRTSEVRFEETELDRLRSYLTHKEAPCRAAAATLLSQLGDDVVVPQLARMIGDPEAAVRRASHAALVRLTGMTFGASAPRWMHWHQKESTWWKERGERMVARLGDMRSQELLSTLNELTAHALHRKKIGTAVVPLLDDPNPTVIMMALSVLESTKAKVEADAVLALVDDSRPDISRQAKAVFSSLTGRSARSRKRARR